MKKRLLLHNNCGVMDERTVTGTNFLSVATKIMFRSTFRGTPRIPLLPPPMLDGLLTDSTNSGYEGGSPKLSWLE